MALCIPITKYREVKKLRDDALQKIEDVTKEFDELKETTEEYKTKYEDLQKKLESTKSMSPGGFGKGDETDGGTLLLEGDAYKTEAAKFESWPDEMKVRDLAKMSIEYLHQGQLSKDLKGSRATLKGTLSIKPLEITVVNLSKKTTLQIASSYFKSGRFASQPEGVIEAGESHTYGISSKDGRAKTSVKGGLSFVVCDVPEPMANGDAGMEEDEEDATEDEKEKKKRAKEEKKKERLEKKEAKLQKRKSKKEAKKSRKGSEKGSETSEPKENGEGEEEEKPEEENGKWGGDEDENDNTITEENEDGEANESIKEEPQSPKEPSIHEDHNEDEDDTPEGNGDFFVVAFENPLAGIPKAKSSKNSGKDIKPLVKQLKNDKPFEQELFGHYKDGKRHFVFVWKDEEVEW